MSKPTVPPDRPSDWLSPEPVRSLKVGESIDTPHGSITFLNPWMADDGTPMIDVRVGDQYESLPYPVAIARFVRADVSNLPPASTEPDYAIVRLLPQEAAHRLIERHIHVMHMVYGLPDHPSSDKRYLATLSEVDRRKSKAAELDVEYTTVWRWVKRYRKRGLRGLLHGNRDLPEDVLDKLTGPVLQVITEFVDGQRGASKKTFVSEYALIMMELQKAGLASSEGRKHDDLGNPLKPAVEVLPERTCQKALSALRGNAPASQDSFTRQQQDKRNELFGTKHAAFSFGELIMIDGTPTDVEVLGPHGLFRPTVLFAIDQETKYLWVRAVAGTARALDVGLLLHDVINPQPFGRLPHQYAPLTTTPKRLIFNSWPPQVGDRQAGVLPGTIIFDHGREGENHQIIALLAQLRVGVDWARAVSPDDKALVESTISTFARRAEVFKGHIGSDVRHRPDRYGKGPHLTFGEFVRALAVFSFWYGRQQHSGLPHPLYPGQFLTPNDAVHRSLAFGRPLRFARNPNLPLQFMPSKPIIPQTYGVPLGKLRYGAQTRESYRRILEASYRPGRSTKLVFHYDPYDTTRLYWNEPRTRNWTTLYAPGGDPATARKPFTARAAAAYEDEPGSKLLTTQGTAVAVAELGLTIDMLAGPEPDESVYAAATTPKATHPPSLPSTPRSVPHEPDDALDDYRITRSRIDESEDGWL